MRRSFSKCFVSPNVTIASGCIVGAGCQLLGEQNLAENTVIYGNNNCEQREAIEKSSGAHMLQLDFLRKVLPNYHHLRKQIK